MNFNKNIFEPILSQQCQKHEHSLKLFYGRGETASFIMDFRHFKPLKVQYTIHQATSFLKFTKNSQTFPLSFFY